MKKLFGIVLGAIIIAVGVLSGLSAFGIADISISLDGWWTFFIIVPAVMGLASGKDWAGSLAMLFVGIYLLLAAQGVIDYSLGWKIIVPVLIVILGIKLIVKTVKTEEGVGKAETAEPDAVNAAECTATFTETNADFSGMEINAAKVCALFGGARCNLTDTKFEAGSTVHVLCIFGGADIILPDYVSVKTNALCLFGGISDKRAVKPENEKTAEITVNGLCLFGGADIK